MADEEARKWQGAKLLQSLQRGITCRGAVLMRWALPVTRLGGERKRWMGHPPPGSLRPAPEDPAGRVPGLVEKETWRILPVGEVHDQPAALAGGHRRNAPWTNLSGSRQRRTSRSESRSVS